ncbi:MAG: phosphoribosylformylglycinamidine synthase subunit PurS [Campylobacterales bacterium]
MKVFVNISLKEGVLDPQGKAIEHALHTMGFGSTSDVRVGKRIELDIDTDSSKEAKKQASQMCESLLANTVIENYEIEIVE